MSYKIGCMRNPDAKVVICRLLCIKKQKTQIIYKYMISVHTFGNLTDWETFKFSIRVIDISSHNQMKYTYKIKKTCSFLVYAGMKIVPVVNIYFKTINTTLVFIIICWCVLVWLEDLCVWLSKLA